MKTGILTFHRCINYGSYWQTRCLAEKLQQHGLNVFILDHRSKKVDIAEWKCALEPVLPTPVPVSDHALYRKKIEKFFTAFESLPLSKAFELEYPQQMDEYDLVVVGSDEVWNLSHPWYGFYPAFFGEGIRSKRLISYAASFGNYDVNWRLSSKWLKKLYNFDKILVRDKNSQLLIKNNLGFEPEIVLDPCLLYPQPVENIKSPSDDKKYAAIYGHNFSNSFIKKIKDWAHKSKTSLISIGYRNDWADEQWLTAGPEEFASFIAQSKAVISNFFHGCVFAIIYSKTFVCEASDYRSHKINDLLERVGAKNHLINESSEVAAMLENPINENIHSNIDYLREKSNIHLEKALALKAEKVYEKL